MRESTKLGLALAASIGLGLAILYQQMACFGAITRLAATLERESIVSTITSTWTSGGVTRTLTTTRGENETAAEFAARHEAEFAAMLALFPRDP